MVAPNLNLVHSYYQLPLAFPIGLSISLVLEEVFSTFPRKIAIYSSLFLKVMMTASCVWVLQSAWFEFGFVGKFSPYKKQKSNQRYADRINEFFKNQNIDNTSSLVKNVAICDLRTVAWDPHSILFLTNSRGISMNRDHCSDFLKTSSHDYNYVFILRELSEPQETFLGITHDQRRILIQL